jgi:catechol-2,3-dioxygenase
LCLFRFGIIPTEVSNIYGKGHFMIKVKAIDHLVIRAHDDQKLTDFYVKVIGCSIERQLPQLGLTQLRAGNALIDIVAVNSELGKVGGVGPKLEGKNLDHFCLLIESIEQQTLTDYLDKRKIEHGQFERRYGSEGFNDSVYIHDPEGNIIELKCSVKNDE